MRGIVHVFARFPQRGRVKTRLARTVGATRALGLHRWMTRRTLATARSLAAVRVVLWTAGSHWHPLFAGHPPADRRWQRPGGLGQRMSEALAFSADRRQPGLVIGTDCPELRAATLDAAFAALESSDVVLGPALDGGYYLVGARQRVPRLFRGIEWGTATVLDQTLCRARAAGWSVALLPSLRDVDEASDLAALGLRRTSTGHVDALALPGPSR